MTRPLRAGGASPVCQCVERPTDAVRAVRWDSPLGDPHIYRRRDMKPRGLRAALRAEQLRGRNIAGSLREVRAAVLAARVLGRLWPP